MKTDVYAWIIPFSQFHTKAYQQLKTKASADLAVPSPHRSSRIPQQGTHTFWQSSAQPHDGFVKAKCFNKSSSYGCWESSRKLLRILVRGRSFGESSSNQRVSREPLPSTAAGDEGGCKTCRLELWQLIIPVEWLHFESCRGNAELLQSFHNQLFFISLQTFTSTIPMLHWVKSLYLGTTESRHLNNKGVSRSVDFVSQLCTQLNGNTKFLHFSTEILYFCRTQRLCTPAGWPVASQATPTTMPVHRKH